MTLWITLILHTSITKLVSVRPTLQSVSRVWDTRGEAVRTALKGKSLISQLPLSTSLRTAMLVSSHFCTLRRRCKETPKCINIDECVWVSVGVYMTSFLPSGIHLQLFAFSFLPFEHLFHQDLWFVVESHNSSLHLCRERTVLRSDKYQEHCWSKFLEGAALVSEAPPFASASHQN